MNINTVGLRYHYLYKKACSFYLNKLLDKSSYYIDVCIYGDKHIVGDGDCHEHEKGVYDINLNKKMDTEYTRNRILLTLAHECVHLKQFYRKEELNEEEAYRREKGLREQFLSIYFSTKRRNRGNINKGITKQVRYFIDTF